MKKFLAIPLLCLYTLAISGVMIQMHYCGSDLESWNVTAADSACCCEDGSERDHTTVGEKDCCTNKTLVVKTVQDQYLSSGMQLLFGAWQPVPTPIKAVFDLSLPTSSILHSGYQANAPPGLWQNIPLFLLHQRFIVYS